MTIKDSPPIVDKPIDDTTTTSTTEPNIDLSSGSSSLSSPPQDTPAEDSLSFPVNFEPFAPSSLPFEDRASDKPTLSPPKKNTLIEKSASPVVFKPWPPSYPPVQRGNDDNDNHHHAKCCRICLEDDYPQDMIAPCLCKGSSKWVHRQCLNQWRIHETDRAFSKCTECLFVYHLQPAAPSAITILPSIRRRVKYTLLVTRDVCLATLYLQLAIAFLGWIVSAIDSDRQLPSLMNSDMPVAIYYLCGFLLVLVIVGFVGMMIFCCNGCSVKESLALFPEGNMGDQIQPSYRERSAHYQQSRQSYQNQDHYCVNCYLCCGSGGGGSSPSPTYYYSDVDGCCNLCLCCSDGCSNSAASGASSSSGGGGGGDGGCGDGCDGDGAAILLFILLALAVILAIIGFVIGVVLCVIIFQRTLQRHIYILHKRQLAGEFQVMDLAVYDLDNYGSMQDVEQPEASSTKPHPSAPTLPERDVIYLRDIGLME